VAAVEARDPPGTLATVRPEGLDEHAAAVVPSRPASRTADAARRLCCRHGDRIAVLLEIAASAELYARSGHNGVSRSPSNALEGDDEPQVGRTRRRRRVTSL
jgi:hypothetical protein